MQADFLLFIHKFIIQIIKISKKCCQHFKNILEILYKIQPTCYCNIETKSKNNFNILRKCFRRCEMASKETKREKFVRLAENRTNRILSTLVLLGNCSNTGAYEYTQKDVDKIFNAIQAQVNDTKKRFTQKGTGNTDRFTLE